MSNILEVAATLRSDMGKGASRRLRRLEDLVPAVIYGAGIEAQSLTLDHKKLLHALENEAFYSSILTVDVAGKKQKAILKALQRHPSKSRVLHADFLRVSATEKLTMKVPLHFIGGDEAPGVVDEGGVLSHGASNVEISCFPGDLPEFIQVDVSKLGMDQTLHLSDLKAPKGVEIVALSLGEGHDLPVASVHMPRIIVEEEPVEEVTEGEEGAESAEGAEAKGKDDSKGDKSE